MNVYEQLKRDEGEVLEVYPDSKGIPTGGVGHNLAAHGLNWPIGTPISQEQSDEWFAMDLAAAEQSLSFHCPWSDSLDDARKGVLVNMIYNMGWGDGIHHGLSTFHHTLAMIEDGDYDDAANNMLQSKWAREVGDRAQRLAVQLRTGEWQ